MKSGGYTVEKPLLIGAALGGASPDVEAVLAAYGRPLGEAFQLRDDVLGAFGVPAVTGKDAESDLREGKRTLLVARAVAAANTTDRTFLEANLGRVDLGHDDAERMRAIFRSSGALASTQALIEELHGSALAALEGAHIPRDARAALVELGDLAISRES
jgi:geranylgeranyl diphosphate synthase type I